MNAFERFHPGVILLYFALVLGIHIGMFEPVLLGLSFLSLSTLNLYLKGLRAGGIFIGKCMLLFVVCTCMNALLNHRGMSVLFFMGGLPVTVESAFYGAMTGLLLVDSILLFRCFHHMMTSEKLMCLFGSRFPSFSLIFSMVLGLVPKIRRDYEKIRENHGMCRGVVSALIGLSLEDSLEMGISMRYRGYGKGKRTSIYQKRFTRSDGFLLAAAVFLATVCAGCYFLTNAQTEYYPVIEFSCSAGGMAAYISAFFLLNLPMLWNVKEEIRWKHIVSSI